MEFSTDWTRRVGQLNDYVAAYCGAMDTSGSTLEEIAEYLEATILEVEGYTPEPGDVSVIRKAVARIMKD